jgi:hypothetical protein
MKIKVLQVLALSAIVTLVWGESSNAFPEPQQQAGSQLPAKQAPRKVMTPLANVALMDKNSYGQLPMQFEKNQGQTDSRVQFLARGGGYTLFLSPEEAVFSLRPPKLEKERTLRAGRKGKRQLQSLQPKKASVLRMKLADGNRAPIFEGTDQLPGSVNYLIGKDPSKWQVGIPVFTGVRVLNVYPKIDMVYYGNSRQLEYDFVVNPGADPSRIAFEFQGATGVSLAETGEVQIDSQAGRVTIHKPSIYQMEHGLKKVIDGNFAMRDGRKVGVEVKNYDRTKPLVVDPVLAYSTYLGGSGQDSANDIAVDSQGYAYVTGDTSSVDFPTVSPAISSVPNGTTIGFVSKLNQTGTALVYSTYLGGTTNDSLQGIALDGAGQVYVTGMTASVDFPVTSANAFQVSYGLGATLNAFVAKISADGRSLLYSTYLGGNSDDEGTSIAVDANQNAYVAGYTSSSTFPVTAARAFQSTLNSPNGNGFIARIDTTQTGNNSLIYSTFLGGSSPYSMAQLPSGSFGGDGVLGIAIDSNQNAYVVGDASSIDFPLTASKAFQTTGSANNSVFLTRLDTSKSGASGLIYSTFLGGTGPYGDLGSRVALDPLGNTYLTGDAFSMDFPTTVGGTNSANGKAFVAKFNTNLSGVASLIYSTLVGGTGGEQAFAIAVNPEGDAYVGGDTGSTDFPVTSGAIQTTLRSSSWNGFIAGLMSDGSTIYGSYFGGSGIGSGDHVQALAIDSNANVYFAGQTDSTDIPTTSGVLQTTLGGTTNSFIGKLTGLPSLVSVALTPQGFAIPLGMTQQVSAIGAYTDGSLVDLTSTATWSSSSSATTVNSSGLVAGASLGTSIIQVTSGTVSSSINVTVGPPALVSLALTPSTGTVFSGASLQFQLVGTYTDGSTRNLTNSAAWFAVPSQTALVNSGGFATGVAPGTATLTVVSGALFATANLTVQATSLVTIVVTPNRASIPVGNNQQFIATGNYSDGSTQDITSGVTWTSSNGAGASVNSTGLATANGQGSSTLSASSGGITGSAIMSVTAGTFSLNTDRYQHSATLLNNGPVLFAGGLSCSSPGTCTYLNSAELYDPISGSVTATGGLSVARSAPAVLLGNGKVLVAGGYSCDVSGNCASLSSTEIYDSNSGAFGSAGNMTIDRSGHTMTLLATGKVLIAGGQSCTSASTCNALTTAELFDPVAGTFTPTGSLGSARYNASAATLSNGKVLIAGGFNGVSYPANAELYDLASGTFSVAGALHTPRANATATWLELSADTILIAGGSTCVSQACPTASTEYYQGGNIYNLGNMAKARQNETATLLTNGQLFIAGGLNSCATGCVSDATSTLYNPQTFSFTSSQSLATARAGHTATLLTDGSVLLVGGINNGVTLSSTELYQSPNLTLPQLGSILIAPSNTPVQIGSTLTLVAKGFDTYGSYLGPLTAVNWNSSSPSVAGVSNATGSAGIVNALSRGTTIITASVGTISSTTAITVTPVLLSISVTPANPTIPLNSTQSLRLTATANYSDGSSENLTSNVTWTNSNTSAITLVPNVQGPGTDILLIPVAVGSSTLSASFNGQTGSSTVNVVAPPTIVAPRIDSVSPTSGAAGTQVTILGSGFGMNPSGSTVWLGTTLGNVVSWNDSQVIAAVATGSATGVAQIHQGAVASNAISFTVNTPSILSVTPTSGITGTQVTVNGSGFGLSQGTVWLGNAAGVVSQWNDGVIIATVAPGAASGNAQVLQNGVWSNAVPFTINVPHVTKITPNSGPAGTAVVITGNGFGPSPGIALIGNSSATVITKWTDSEIDATVAPSSMTGIVKVQQNGIWSNALTFNVTGNSGSSTPVTVNPNLLTLQVGETHSIQALDASGKPVKGLTWTSSNTSVATLSTDDPPIINALSVGYTTISAGDASADITVLASAVSLPIGTVICKNPGTGPDVVSIIPAVPSPSGVADVFALQADGTVLAITTDCQTAWTAQVGIGNTIVADFQGGLVVGNGQSIYKLDGITGQPYPSYTSVAGNTLTTPLVHTDGTIFTVDGDRVVGLNPLTGRAKFDVRMDNWTTSSTSIDVGRSGGSACYSSPLPQSSSGTQTSSPPGLGNMIIAGDGYSYLPFIFGTSVSVSETDVPAPITMDCSDTYSNYSTSSLRLLRVGTQGDSYVIPLGDWASSTYRGADHVTSASAPLPNLLLSTPITNADNGILFAWSLKETSNLPPCPPGALFASGCSFPNSSVKLTTTSGPGISAQATLKMSANLIQPTLQRADGSYVGTDGTNMYAFTASGTPLWTVPNDTPQIATSVGGVIGASGVTYDPDGKATGQLGSLPIYSWKGNAYQYGSVEEFTSLPFIVASLWSFAGGNPSSNGTASRAWYFILNWQNAFDFIPDKPFVRTDLRVDITNQAATIKAAALAALKEAFRRWNVNVVEGRPGTGDHQAVVQTTSTDQGPSCGSTNINVQHPTDSEVWYECNMEQAQWALSIAINNTQDENNALNRKDLIQAIGRGIGNNAAHEIAHQFLILCCSMDAHIKDDPHAAGTYNNGSANGDADPDVVNSDPSPYTGYWKDGKTAIKWESTTQAALDKCLADGWRYFSIACSTKLYLSQNIFLSQLPRGVAAKALTPRWTKKSLKKQDIAVLPFLTDVLFGRW